jgi:hypothetical protein
MTEPNTVDTSEECPNCGRSISADSQALLDDACLFCRESDET